MPCQPPSGGDGIHISDFIPPLGDSIQRLTACGELVGTHRPARGRYVHSLLHESAAARTVWAVGHDERPDDEGTMTNGGPFEGLVPNLARVCVKTAVVMCKG